MLEKSRLKAVAEVAGADASEEGLAEVGGALDGDAADDPAGALGLAPELVPEPPQAATIKAVLTTTDAKPNFFMTCTGTLLSIE